jgi:hypothetical protein
MPSVEASHLALALNHHLAFGLGEAGQVCPALLC